MNSTKSDNLTGRNWLIAGGTISLAIASLHLVIVTIGSVAYRYFGAGEDMATMDARGEWAPAIITIGIAAVFSVFGVYAYSGAGLVRRLPLQRTVLVAVGAIYLLRGLLIFWDIAQLVGNPTYPFRACVFSFVSLAAGLIHLYGLGRNRAAFRAHVSMTK